MYFPDLTPYSYIKHESHTLNVGWLSAEYPYLTGNTTHTVAVLVKDYLRYPVHSCSFGVHQCMFCPDPISAVKMTREIRVIGLNEIAYASPTMIYHYITVHHYLPPQVFIDAVLQGPRPGSPSYRDLAKRFPWASQLTE